MRSHLQATRYYQAHRLAHVPAHLDDSATCEWRRREGRAGTIASWLVPDHDGRVRPGGDTGQAQCAGKSCGDAAGDEERREVGLRVVCPSCVPGEKRGLQQGFYFVGVRDKSQFEHIVRLAFDWGNSECANLQHSQGLVRCGPHPAAGDGRAYPYHSQALTNSLIAAKFPISVATK